MKTMKTISSIIMLVFLTSTSFGQQLKPLAYEVQKKHQENVKFTQIDNLLQEQQNSALSTLIEKEVREAQIVSYDLTLASEIISNRYPALTFDIELDNELKTIEVVLVKQSFSDYVLNSSSGTIPETTSNRGIHYRGIVLGDENSSLVALSIFKNELIGVISTNDKGDFNIGKLKDQEFHVVYNDANLLDNPTFECLSDVGNVETHTQNNTNFAKSNNPEDYCVNVYFEVDNEIYVNEGSSIANTEAFVIGIFNQTAAIYQNESITVQISEILVWDTPDSYSNTNVTTARNQFVSANPTFNGDLAQLLEFGSSGAGGIAYGIGGLCGNTSSPGPYAATSLFPDFSVVPTYSRQVKVLTHEMGHNFNSRHTHACVWNGNNTSYDDYGNYNSSGVFNSGSEGASCVDQANPKLSETPTIMSYYDSRGFGTFPMSNGFGDQPGDVVRAAVLNATCLSLCDPVSCNTTITSFPYSESFETSLGAWQQASNDDFDWTRKSGSTSSSQTGPTAASDGSFYAYVESSSPNYPAKTTILNSPCFDLSGQNGTQLSFAYHMYGASMGTLDLQVSTDGGSSWTSEWSLSGDQGNQWSTATVDLGAYSGSTISLRYVGTTSTSYRSDMAVDDITLSESACNALITSFPYSESFESNLGDWQQDSSDDFDWTRKSGSTSSTSTGPAGAFAGTYYVYVESSSPNYPAKTTILNSPCFDLSGLSSPQLNFSYHMYGASMGTLDLQVSTDGGTSWTSEWSLSGDQGNQWSVASVDLAAYSGSTISLRYVGTTSTSYRSDMAVDDISLADNSCNAVVSSFPYTESFESSFGSWEQSTDDDFDWTRKSGSTSSTSTGPTSASDGSFYAYVESSSPNYPAKTTIMNSPCFNLSGQSGTSLSFSYHMYGASMGTLDLQVSSNGGGTWTSVWSLSGDQGNQWYTANVNLDAYAGSTLQLRYVGTTSTSYRSDMAVDDISLNVTQNANDDVMIAETNSSDIDIYPNPANEYTIVDISSIESDETNIVILDMLGKEIYSTTSVDEETRVRIPTNTFSPGSYMVIIISNTGETFNRKLIVND